MSQDLHTIYFLMAYLLSEKTVGLILIMEMEKEQNSWIMADKVSYIIEEIVARLPEVAAAGGRRYGTALGLSLSTASSISFPFLQKQCG